MGNIVELPNITFASVQKEESKNSSLILSLP